MGDIWGCCAFVNRVKAMLKGKFNIEKDNYFQVQGQAMEN